MRVVVLGAGAVGSLLGARLVGAGATVTLVGRADHVAAIRASGLEVVGVRPGRFSVRAEERLPGDLNVDAALIGVKTYDLETAAADLARTLPAPVPTLLPQNGLGVEELAAAGARLGGWAEPSRWLVRAIHSIPATLLGPGRVRQAGDGEILFPSSDADQRAAVEVWVRLAASLGYPLRRLPDFAREVWRKAAINAAINPVTADHRVVNGRLRVEPWRGEALVLLAEAREVAASEGVLFTPGELEEDLWRVVEATAENHSSMLQDVERGRRTEIDQISGEILRLGRGHGLALPATERIVRHFTR